MVKIKSENLNLAQGKICMGYKSQNIQNKQDEFYELLVFNEILGGGTSSKLFNNVREKESLCYSINSLVYRFKVLILVQCGVEIEKIDYVIDLIKSEIKKLTDGDFSDEDLEKGKNSLIKKYEGIMDYTSALMDFYVTQHMLEDEDGLETIIERIKKINKEAVCNRGKNMLLDMIYIGGNNDYSREVD